MEGTGREGKGRDGRGGEGISPLSEMNFLSLTVLKI